MLFWIRNQLPEKSLRTYDVTLVTSYLIGLAQTMRPNWQSLLANGLAGMQMWSIYKVYLKRRGKLLFQV